VAVSSDASIDAQNPDGVQTDAQRASPQDAPNDRSESDLDGPAPPVPGIDAAVAPADASLAGEAGLPDRPAGADGGAVGTLDAYAFGGAIDGGHDGSAASNGNDEGCGCHLGAQERRLPSMWTALLVAFAALLLRRRRR
jgi:MYXO-CTERM domain-containing protein